MNIPNPTDKRFISSTAGQITLAAALSAAATAAWVESKARRAERDHPAEGQFSYVDDVRLHCVVRGKGPDVVLLHGNNVSLEDFNASGLIDSLAEHHRVIAFDRPGYGHSSRPRDRFWMPSAQAALLHKALQQLGVKQATVVGHSMGTLVALALAMDFPQSVSNLVLMGGYFYPSMRVDALLTAPVALPVVGDVMRYTVTALSARALLNKMVKMMFAPNQVPSNFFPLLSREMMLRPVQLRANAEDAAFMIPQAMAQAKRFGELKMHVTLIAGADDKVVDVKAHSERLHAELPHSELHVVPNTGHMVHYFAKKLVFKAIDKLQDGAAATNRVTDLADKRASPDQPKTAASS